MCAVFKMLIFIISALEVIESLESSWLQPKFNLFSTRLNFARRTEFYIVLPRRLTSKEKLAKMRQRNLKQLAQLCSHLRILDILNVLFVFFYSSKVQREIVVKRGWRYIRFTILRIISIQSLVHTQTMEHISLGLAKII